MGCVLVSSPVEVSRAEVPRSDVQARGVLGSMVLPTGLRPSLGRALDATWKPCLVLTLTVLDAAATSPAPHSKHLGTVARTRLETLPPGHDTHTTLLPPWHEASPTPLASAQVS